MSSIKKGIGRQNKKRPGRLPQIERTLHNRDRSTTQMISLIAASFRT